jgi:hypothetical protein
MEGYLMKKGDVGPLKKWKKRYFIFKSEGMYVCTLLSLKLFHTLASSSLVFFSLLSLLSFSP